MPHLIRYQGQAVDAQGVPLEGPYTLTFRLYNAATGGTPVWEEAQPGVTLQGGHFSVLLGQITPLDGMDWTQPRWLSVQLGTEPELAPRQQLTSVPMAMVAERLDGPITTAGDKVGIGTTSPTNALSVFGSFAGYSADVTGSGTPSASSGTAANAFDNDLSTWWAIGVVSYPQWLAYDFGAGNAKAINKYTIIPDRCNSAPGAWQLQASQDNTTWTVLDNRTSFGSCTVGSPTEFTCSNATAYRYYRLSITANNGHAAGDLDLYEVELMQPGPGSVLEVTVGGLVGLGTLAPSAKLHLNSGRDQTGLIIDDDVNPRLRLRELDATPRDWGLQVYADSLKIADFTANANRLTINSTGAVGIGTDTPTNILTIQQGSVTDPIADSWIVYPSDRKHKKILRAVPHGYLDQMRSVEVYEWTRVPSVSETEVTEALGTDRPDPEARAAKQRELETAKASLPKFMAKRVGVVIDDANVPPEILAFNPDGTKAGIDLLAYVGYLHATLKEAVLKIDELEARLPRQPRN